MQDLYATTFTLASLTDAAPYELALDQVANWSWERLGEMPNFSARVGTLENDHNWRLQWLHVASDSSNDQALRLTLQHPDRTDATMLWRTAVVLSRDEATTRATVRLARGAQRHLVRPGRFEMRPPGVTARLLDRPLRGYAGAIAIRPVAERLGAAETEDYACTVLEHPHRVLPVVVLARDSVISIGANELARRLVGLAHVTVLTDSLAAEALEKALPDGLFVPPEGARLYWPGIGSEKDVRHRYWTRHQLRRVPLDRELRRILAGLSVARVPRDDLPERLATEQARAAVQQRREEAAVSAATRAKTQSLDEQLRDLTARYEGLDAEVVSIVERNETLERDNQVLRAEVSDLGAQLETARENVAAAYDWRESGFDVDDEHESDESSPPESWDEFETRLDDLTGPGFQLTERARACARDGAYPGVTRMWEHLQRLADAGHAFNQANANVGTRFSAWAARFRLDVALQDSTYANHQFVHDGVTLSRLPHVKIDDAVAPNEVGRIYFAIDSEAARLVVDWFGVKRDRP